ncbi:MAG: hypothetical protein JO254_11990 [Pseudolabrys sp.]|nr:hypothetical protein [Pseudolabrys sp.]
MRKILSISVIAAAAFASPALAATKCNIPPPPWWNAPKVTNVYDGGGRSSSNIFASTHTSWRYDTHTFSAQRRAPSQPVRYRDPFRRW